jgi:hypothetical protein
MSFELRINRENFLLDEIPQYHPASIQYENFWKEEKRRNIEGYWQQGYWMPGKLYFYGNQATILVNKKHSKVKYYDRPWIRDLEWAFFPLWEEARGFSGFAEDPKYSCNRMLLDPEATDEDLRNNSPFVFTEDGERKLYESPRTYLRRYHDDNYGRPLYENDSMNLMMMGPRGFGKSYAVGAGIVAHEFLFDGCQHYTEEFIANPSASTTIVGAGDAKYSNDILSKTKVTIDRLPGSMKIGDEFFPSPLSKRFKGSWQTGKEIIAHYDIKVGGSWKKDAGSGSRIKNLTFKDNPYVAQGTRAGVMVFEEIGMFNNLMESYENSVDCMKDGSTKFGSAMFLGTGGDMDKGTLSAYKMFYNPKKFNLLEFDDIWEHKGKISYFVPAWLGDNKYKDDEGYTLKEKAIANEEKQRKVRSGGRGSSSVLDSYIVYHPMVPSEVFLVKNNNIFPVAELKRRRQEIETSKVLHTLEKKVELFYDPDAKVTGGVNYTIDINNRLKPIREFPIQSGDSNREGAVVIYEFPQVDPDTNKVPDELYLIGHDPFATDNPDGPSLASIYVIKTKKHKYKYGHDEIVAQYIGRPFMGRAVVNEILLKLAMFYNAKIFFENVRGNVKEYFEKKRKLSYLAVQPQTVLSKKASYNQRGSQVYGYPMSSQRDKVDVLLYMKDWLLEERGEDGTGRTIRNLDLIPDPGLIDELIYFNMEGNFDRVMGFAGCIIGLEETYNQYKEEIFDQTDNHRKLNFLSDNKYLFNTTPRSLSSSREFSL